MYIVTLLWESSVGTSAFSAKSCMSDTDRPSLARGVAECTPSARMKTVCITSARFGRESTSNQT